MERARYVLSPDAENDLGKLDNSQRAEVIKALRRIGTNPNAREDGGYGTPLGNKRGTNLTGFMKAKLRRSGIRIVYRVVMLDEAIAAVLIIGMRSDDKVYIDAAKRHERFAAWAEQMMKAQ